MENEMRVTAHHINGMYNPNRMIYSGTYSIHENTGGVILLPELTFCELNTSLIYAFVHAKGFDCFVGNCGKAVMTPCVSVEVFSATPKQLVDVAVSLAGSFACQKALIKNHLQRNIIEIEQIKPPIQKMRLAQALLERERVKAELAKLDHAIEVNSALDEGMIPEISINDMLSQFMCLSDRLECLDSHIFITDRSTMVRHDRSLWDILEQKKLLTKQLEHIAELVKKEEALKSRFADVPIKLSTSTELCKHKKAATKIANQIAKLNETLHKYNWMTELQ